MLAAGFLSRSETRSLHCIKFHVDPIARSSLPAASGDGSGGVAPCKFRTGDGGGGTQSRRQTALLSRRAVAPPSFD
jgi:hypothetical protein